MLPINFYNKMIKLANVIKNKTHPQCELRMGKKLL